MAFVATVEEVDASGINWTSVIYRLIGGLIVSAFVIGLYFYFRPPSKTTKVPDKASENNEASPDAAELVAQRLTMVLFWIAIALFALVVLYDSAKFLGFIKESHRAGPRPKITSWCIKADGNCLFRAIAHYVYPEEGGQNAWKRVKAELLQHYNESEDEVVKDMREAGVFELKDDGRPSLLDVLHTDKLYGSIEHARLAGSLYGRHFILTDVHGNPHEGVGKQPSRAELEARGEDPRLIHEIWYDDDDHGNEALRHFDLPRPKRES